MSIERQRSTSVSHGTRPQAASKRWCQRAWNRSKRHLASLLLGLALAAASSTLAQAPPENFALHAAPRALPGVAFQDGSGEPRSLADFRGRVVLLNVWATWCPPCRQEMPTLDRLQAELGGDEFEVVALSVDRLGVDAVREFYAEIDIRNLSVYIDPSMKAMRGLAVVGLPTTLLLDRQGHEIGRLIGPAEWDAPEMIAFFKSQIERSP